MPVNRSFEHELAQLEAMSGRMPDGAGVERVRAALGHQNNYLVGKAARIVADYSLTALLPAVLAAYDRFFEDAVRRDPQCWAKNALVKALVKLGCRDPQVYLRGLHHTQEEPVWGGHSDTAGTLRATCTHALVECPEIGCADLLDILLGPLLDSDKTVRIEAAKAIGNVGGVSAALLLKLRILLRKDEPEVLGACFSALLGMEKTDRKSSIALVAGFLDDGEEAAAEAAFALAELHELTALNALLARRCKGTDPWFGSILDHAIAVSRLPEALEFLLSVIEEDARRADSAIEAIGRVYGSPEVRKRVQTAVSRSRSERALQAFRQHFPEKNLDR